MALKPRANAASIMACAAAPAESVCSMTGIFTVLSPCAATTTISGARNALSRSRCRPSSPICGCVRRKCAASTAPSRSRAAPRTTTNRHGRRRPWSGARAAAEKMSSSAPASGAGSVSARAERRASRASMACMAPLSQTHAMLSLSEACERNKGPILAVLRAELAGSTRVLEVGSGTGQHAVYFAAALPQLVWQPSELAENLAPLAERVRLEGGANLREPLALDVRAEPWPVTTVDAVFSANTLHIMAWNSVCEFFRGAAAARGAVRVRTVPLRGTPHERQQRRLRPLPQAARSRQRRARFRSARSARAGARTAVQREPRDAGQQSYAGVALRRSLECTHGPPGAARDPRGDSQHLRLPEAGGDVPGHHHAPWQRSGLPPGGGGAHAA